MARVRREPRGEILDRLDVAEALRAGLLQAGACYADPDWVPPGDGLPRLDRAGFAAQLAAFDEEIAELKRQLALPVWLLP
jgi:hypothetical protein